MERPSYTTTVFDCTPSVVEHLLPPDAYVVGLLAEPSSPLAAFCGFVFDNVQACLAHLGDCPANIVITDMRPDALLRDAHASGTLSYIAVLPYSAWNAKDLQGGVVAPAGHSWWARSDTGCGPVEESKSRDVMHWTGSALYALPTDNGSEDSDPFGSVAATEDCVEEDCDDADVLEGGGVGDLIDTIRFKLADIQDDLSRLELLCRF